MTSNSLDLTKGFDEFDAKSQRFKRMRSLATLLLVV
jgi:hypothetical protein